MASESKIWINVWRAAFCLGGLTIAVAAMLLHEVAADRHIAALGLGSKVLEALGLGVFVTGMLTLVLDLNHWKEYFEGRLSNVVIGQEYLKELSQEALLRHQIRVFRIYYHDEDLSDGGFIRFCLSRIHGYIVTPYRENVQDTISVEVLGPSQFKITEHLTYICRKAGGKIQDRLAWQANTVEVSRMESLSLTLEEPTASTNAGRQIARVLMQDMQQTRDKDGSITYEYQLAPEYQQKDGLVVKFDGSYISEQSAFYTWRMMDPSEDVELTVHYPDNLRIQFKPFLLEPEPTDCVDQPGFFKVMFRSWIMPRSGFAWKLLPSGLPSYVESGKTSLRESPKTRLTA